MMGPPKKYTDGSEYNGNFNDKGEKDGNGTLVFKDGTKYHGNFQNGFFSGHGVLEVRADKGQHKYQGQFANGKFEGYGVFTQSDNMMYEGEFHDGAVQGLGRVTFKEKTHGVPHYEGRFANGEIVERQQCAAAIQEARKAATTASQL